MNCTYHVDYVRDGAVWMATVREIEGCHTQGSSVTQARERIREAISLFDDRSASAELIDCIDPIDELQAIADDVLAWKSVSYVQAARRMAEIVRALKQSNDDVANTKIQLREVCLIATGLAYSVRVSWDVEEREKNLAAWEKFVLESSFVLGRAPRSDGGGGGSDY